MLSFMKKAQTLSLNVIIVAAIALLVLVILSVIFIGVLKSNPEEATEQEVNDCITMTKKNCDYNKTLDGLICEFEVKNECDYPIKGNLTIVEGEEN